ncbi:MAG: hypothetical protein ACFFDY_07155, partial [Candidatus Thorarchaeota archaeon]
MIEDIIIYGAVQGSVYALLALGYSLVYGVGGVLNLAHGSYYLIAAYIFYITWVQFQGVFGFYLGMILGLIVATILGAISYFVIIKPLEEHEISMLMGTFAIGFFIEQLAIAILDPKFHYLPPIWDQNITVLGVVLQLHWIIIIIVSIIIVSLVIIFINKSK